MKVWVPLRFITADNVEVYQFQVAPAIGHYKLHVKNCNNKTFTWTITKGLTLEVAASIAVLPIPDDCMITIINETSS